MSSGKFIEICKEEVRKHNEQHMNKTKILRWATRKTATAQADATSVLKRSE